MIIYTKSFSNPSVSISHDAMGLSAVVIVVFPDHTHLLFLTRRLVWSFSYNSPTPMAARFYHQFK